MSNIVEPKTLPGFMELMPQDQILFDKIKNIIEEVYSSYGFYNLDTPLIESSNVLLAKAGGETEKQIYRFNKGDNDLSLRFDLTVPLAKYVAARYNELVFPFKRYQIGKVYRGERPQKGRFREFYQCDIDVIGKDSLSFLYDAEIPCIISKIFKKIDIGDFVIRINNRKILTGFFDSLELSENITDILRIIDKLDKVGIDAVKDMLKEINIDDESIKKIVAFISIKGTNEETIKKLENLGIENETYDQGLSELKTVINNLSYMDIDDNSYEIDLTIARGLDYYTGTVYETLLRDYPKIGSVCSGGRYDNLASYYTDKKLPGVGISIGLTRLFYQLKESNIIKSEESSVADVVVLPLTQNYEYIYKVVNELRSNEIKTDVCFMDKGFKQLLKYANKQNIDYSVIIGDNEIEKNIAILKNMKTGEQVEVDSSDIVNCYYDLKEKANPKKLVNKKND